MAITRWSPNRDLLTRNVWNEFDRLFNRMLGETSDDFESDISNVTTWRPAIDLDEREKEYVLSAELPGLEKDDISISMKDNVLTIRGEKKYETEDDGDNRYYRERRFGKFQRMIRFDSDIDSENIEADYTNGVLTVHLPKTKETMHKEIPVNFK